MAAKALSSSFSKKDGGYLMDMGIDVVCPVNNLVMGSL
jgi:hypothetical protein